MEQIPSPFDRFLFIKPAEKFFGCWRSVVIPVMTQDGREVVLAASGTYGDGIPFKEPETGSGLLILTDKGLVHCRLVEAPGLIEMRVTGIQEDIKIHREDIRGVDRSKLPGPLREVLAIRVQGDAAQYSPEYVEGQVAGTNGIHFLLDPAEDLQKVHDEVVAALPARSGPGALPGPPASTGSKPALAMVRCPYCGSLYRVSDERCPDCGAPLEKLS
ncbi:MAG: zinc ribbon domain-containing protein [Euryarchaeota archaeon]|nr:zinc ribbon domain-containing protein [Euryarchaeota archaeon]MDE1835239.1 zinc ribbon domain-containing protein [Euryarchaeota archaeon]MDE1881042.1 zinc ribbon domain-containing protein [Euryarchaeota archaeon]MDE2043535.1 zinc ribbon domain-containing protein [Thermoplasmata archaeon]